MLIGACDLMVCPIHVFRLSVDMDSELLKGDSVGVQPYNVSLSNFELLTDPSKFCLEPYLDCDSKGRFPNNHSCVDRGSRAMVWYCRDGHEMDESYMGAASARSFAADFSETPDFETGTMRPAALGGTPPRNPFEEAWVPMPVHMVPGSTSTVAADLSQVNYRWQLRLFFDYFGTISRDFSTTHGYTVPPRTRRGTHRTQTSCPCLLDAGRCLRSDGMTDSRLLAWA